MPLVKQGRIATDLFVHVADGAELPGDGAILVSAARFLDDPEALLRRAGRNRRDLAEQPRYRRSRAVSRQARRGRSGVSEFPDGRAYSQARILRERHGFHGEMRATGQVLRDQFVFMLRAGFDAFEVKKESDAEAFAATVETLLGVLPADRRWPSHCVAPPSAIASFGECRPVNALTKELPIERAIGAPDLPAARRA